MADDGEGRRVGDAVDGDLEPRKLVPEELVRDRQEDPGPSEPALQGRPRVSHDAGVESRSGPEQEGALVGQEHSNGSRGAPERGGSGAPESRGGWGRRGASLGGPPRGRRPKGPEAPASPRAPSEIVPSPPQAATTSISLARNSRTISVACPGPWVGALTS